MNTVVGIAMPAASDKQLSDEQSRVVAALVLEELARRRLSRRRLADQAKISVSTLEKVLACRRPFTLATMVRLEEALGVSLRQNGANGSPAQATVSSLASLAPGDLGFYSRPSVSWLEGTYLTLRPSFGEPSDIYAYQTVLRWDDTLSSLIFKESERVDAEYSQSGLVSMPNQSGFVYLITNRLRPDRARATLLRSLPQISQAHDRRTVREVPAGVSRSPFGAKGASVDALFA